MNQELSTDKEIKDFVNTKFKVEFPMFSKIEVNGPETHGIYKYLKSNCSQMNTTSGLKNIPWNFAKFLVDREGKVVGFFEPRVKPVDMEKDIEALLKH